MEMRLRDHSKPCEHPDPDGAYWVGTRVAETFLCKWSECPGGREITLRRFDIAKSRDMHLLMRESEAWVEVIDEMV